MKYVLENGPWFVDGKPLFVQKWEAGISMTKPWLTNVPLRVEIMNVSLEAWNLGSISKIASRIGNPIIMDRITTSMCEKAYGMASFDRVLVEVDDAKDLWTILKCVIKGLVDLWRLRLNTHGDPLFVVFGHGFDKCTNRELIEAMKKHIASGVMVSQAVIPSPNGPGKRHTTTRDTVPCLAFSCFAVFV
ncbi:zinc knuckle CX2CX4HX4C containing protein [Tanacetum coccineum]